MGFLNWGQVQFEKKKNKNMFWSRIINIVITVLTAIATTFGLNQF
ncbi:MAG: smalltalk protein [Bacteroidaceae bacterium]|nr:smalltalk protein [Bacteroidaceae bacterium]